MTSTCMMLTKQRKPTAQNIHKLCLGHGEVLNKQSGNSVTLYIAKYIEHFFLS